MNLADPHTPPQTGHPSRRADSPYAVAGHVQGGMSDCTGRKWVRLPRTAIWQHGPMVARRRRRRS